MSWNVFVRPMPSSRATSRLSRSHGSPNSGVRGVDSSSGFARLLPRQPRDARCGMTGSRDFFTGGTEFELSVMSPQSRYVERLIV